MGAPASYHQRQGLRQPTAARFPSTCRRVDARHRQGHHCACYIERIRPNLVSYRPASSIPQGPHAGTCLPASNNGAPGCRKAGRVSRIRQGSALHCTCTVPWNIQASPSTRRPRTCACTRLRAHRIWCAGPFLGVFIVRWMRVSEGLAFG
jgi:hypothetical protein